MSLSKHLLPHGGFDVSALSGDTIKLVLSDEIYPFQPLGVREDDQEHYEMTKPGEVVYQDVSKASTTVLTRYFNHRDSERTKIVDSISSDETKSTKDFVLIVESIDGSQEGKAKLFETAQDLVKMYSMVYGNGLIKSYVRTVDLCNQGEEAILSLDF